MRAIHKAKRIIESAPASEEGVVLAQLVLALETGEAFPIGKIYELDYKHFELCLAVMAGWRLDRHYASKFGALSAAVHLRDLQTP